MRNSVLKRYMFRGVVVLCGAGVAVSAAMAQQEAPPPPPPGAQQQAPPPMNPERRVQRMQRRLDLTPDQTAQLRTILVDGMQKMDALRMNGSMAAQDLHARIEKTRKQMEANIRGLLTPEQQAKFDQMQAQMRSREKERRSEQQNGGMAPSGPQDGPPAGPPPPAPQQ